MNPTLKESDHEQAILHWHTEFWKSTKRRLLLCW